MHLPEAGCLEWCYSHAVSEIRSSKNLAEEDSTHKECILMFVGERKYEKLIFPYNRTAANTVVTIEFNCKYTTPRHVCF